MATDVSTLLDSQFRQSFTAPGCGAATFATLGAYRELGWQARAWHTAVVAYRKAIVEGDDLDAAEIDLREALERAGGTEDDVQSMIDEPFADIVTLYSVGDDAR